MAAIQQGQWNSNQCLVGRRGRLEFSQGIMNGVRSLPALQWRHIYIHKSHGGHMLATSSALLYCTALQTQPLSVLKESAYDVACQLKCLSVIHSRKKPIASFDTAWQYCLKGCRRMPDSTGQLTSQSFPVHVTIPSVPLFLFNEWIREEYFLWV